MQKQEVERTVDNQNKEIEYEQSEECENNWKRRNACNENSQPDEMQYTQKEQSM